MYLDFRSENSNPQYYIQILQRILVFRLEIINPQYSYENISLPKMKFLC